MFTLVAKLACALLLAGFAFVSTGCHELYCNFVEGLTGDPIDCSHDGFPELGDIDLPDLPPPPRLPATVQWSDPVVAGEPEQFVATGGFAESERPLRYRWDLDDDGAFDDLDAEGDAGRTATATFSAPGRANVKVQVSSTVANAGTAHGSAVFDVVAGSGPEPPPPPPPDANPLEVSIELNRVIAPPQEEPVVQVTAAVSQDGAPVSGAAVDFDFTSDGTVDADRTTAGEGRASAQHDYPDGTHTVTVNARSGDTAGTASRTFTWNNGQITAAAKPAGAKGRRFTARLGLVTLKEGRFSRRGRTLRRTGELSIGSMSGKFRRRAPARLKAFLASTWLTRSTISFDRKRGRVRVSGIAVATFAAQPGQACVRYSVSSRPRRRFGKGRLSLLGGTGAAATARGVANMRVTSRRGRFVLDGRLVSGTVPARGLTPACESLLRQVRALPG